MEPTLRAVAAGAALALAMAACSRPATEPAGSQPAGPGISIIAPARGRW